MATPIDSLKSMKLHEQLDKGDVGYVLAKDGPFECGRCDFFHSPHSCELVAGEIQSGDCCNMWKPKDDDND